MPKGSSGAIQSRKPAHVRILNEKKPRPEVVSALTDYKMVAVQAFPELKGQMYSQLNKVVEAQFNDSRVMGIYQPSDKKIAISSKYAKINALMRETVAHELGHALSHIN